MCATEQHADLLTTLADGISRLTDSTQWLRHLDCQSRFHRYSFGNVVLIAAQCPEAELVAGFRTWKKLGRTVRKGEKAIWILAPMVTRTPTTGPEDDRVIRGFKYVPVFDVSQTEGEELPTVCHKLSGAEGAESFAHLSEVARVIGYSVEEAELPSGANGDCTFSLRRIRVEIRNSPAQRAKTLAHELAHAYLHTHQQNRAVAEMEAESIAYVVCQRLGLDTGAYTFGYVAAWAGGGAEALAALKASCTNIQRTAQAILDQLGIEDRALSEPARLRHPRSECLAVRAAN